MKETPTDYMNRTVTCYMDKVDWDHEIGSAIDGNKLYPSVGSLKKYCKCWQECGIVQVEVRIKRVIRHSDFFGARKRATQGCARPRSRERR